MTSEQNVSKLVADIRNAPAKPKPKPVVTYSKKERKVNLLELESLKAALAKCKSDITSVTKEKRTVTNEIEQEEKKNTSLLDGLIDDSLADPKKDIVRLLSEANSPPKLNELRGKLVRLEAAFKLLLQKERIANPIWITINWE